MVVFVGGDESLCYNNHSYEYIFHLPFSRFFV